MRNWFIGTNCWQQDIQHKEYVLAVGKAVMLDVLLAYLFYDSWIAVFVLLPVSLWYFHQWRETCCRKKELAFRIQFRDAMQILASALKAGYSVENAIRSTDKDIQTLYPKMSRICQEFELMTHKLNMNQTAEQVLWGFAKRVQQEDVEDFAIVFATSKRMGGDSITILKEAIRMIGDKMEVEREIETMLAAKSMEFQIMCIIPLGMVLYMRFAFPEFLSVLYGGIAGTLLMSVCLLVYILAYYMGRKMIRIEV